MARKLYGAIAWHYLADDPTIRTLNLEKRNGRANYPGDSYITYLTSADLQPLADADIDRMKQEAKAKGITLTTDKISTRRYK